MHHVQCVVIGTILMGVGSSMMLRVQHIGQTEVQMKKLVNGNFMAQFVSFVDILQHKEVVIAVSYPVLLIPVLARLSVQPLVSFFCFYFTNLNFLFMHNINNYSIANFGPDFSVLPVTISPSGSTGTAGETYSLTCSATLHPRFIPFPSDVPSPTFEWFFGPNNSSLPSGVTPMATVLSNVTYTSTLQFSQLSQSHAGMYTC